MACIRIGCEKADGITIWASLVCTVVSSDDENYMVFSGDDSRFVTDDDKQIAVLKPQNGN